MNLGPKVSLVMAVFEGEKYLRHSVESILQQTFSDFEFIIVDDGSQDSSWQLLSEYSSQDPRIHLIRNVTNKGVVSSLNRALSVAIGEYIARQDADDISFPRRLEKQVEFLEMHPDIGLVGTKHVTISDGGNPIDHPDFFLTNADIQKNLLNHCCLSHGSVMLRHECIDRVGAYEEFAFPSEDYDLWLRIAEHYDLANLDEELYAWRYASGSITQTLAPEQAQTERSVQLQALRRRKMNEHTKDNGKY